jgi:hypothetical protein
MQQGPAATPALVALRAGTSDPARTPSTTEAKFTDFRPISRSATGQKIALARMVNGSLHSFSAKRCRMGRIRFEN